MAQLSDETLLLLEDGHCLRDQALDVCRLSGANEKSGFRATSLETLRQMVAAGVGVTLLPALSVQAPADDDEPATSAGDGAQRKRSHRIEIVVEAVGDPKVVRREETSFLFPR